MSESIFESTSKLNYTPDALQQQPDAMYEARAEPDIVQAELAEANSAAQGAQTQSATLEVKRILGNLSQIHQDVLLLYLIMLSMC